MEIHKASLPTHSIGHLNEATFHHALSTHRIFVSKNRGFTIRFENMFDINVYDVRDWQSTGQNKSVKKELFRQLWRFSKNRLMSISKRGAHEWRVMRLWLMWLQYTLLTVYGFWPYCLIGKWCRTLPASFTNSQLHQQVVTLGTRLVNYGNMHATYYLCSTQEV